MRQYADTLITIIEVFLYDPLYQWQLSPQKALQLQQQLDKTNSDSATSSSSHRSSGKEVSYHHHHLHRHRTLLQKNRL